jgi:enoyl-CoA hydratase/carnithine racemase
LGDIFKLQATFAKTNKPIMTVAPGHSFNSGAGLLAASGFPSICHDSKLAFNECTFGFVPHAGSSYYTSRLAGDFGTFLALTGIPITGKDSI